MVSDVFDSKTTKKIEYDIFVTIANIPTQNKQARSCQLIILVINILHIKLILIIFIQYNSLTCKPGQSQNEIFSTLHLIKVIRVSNRIIHD